MTDWEKDLERAIENYINPVPIFPAMSASQFTKTYQINRKTLMRWVQQGSVQVQHAYVNHPRYSLRKNDY